jgi:hypothetical protein
VRISVLRRLKLCPSSLGVLDEFQYTRRRGVSKTQGCPSAGLEERGGMQVPIMLSPDYRKRSTFVRQGGDRNHCGRVRVMI